MVEIEASGSQLYLSGGFGRLAGEARWGLGSVDLSSGRATSFRPEPSLNPAAMEALPDGGLLIGGSWKFLSLAAVPNLARFGPGGETAPPVARGDAPTVVGDVFTGGVVRVYGGDFSGSPVAISVRWLRCAASCVATDRTGWSYTLSDADTGYPDARRARRLQRRG